LGKAKKRECIVQNALPQKFIVPVRGVWFFFAVVSAAFFCYGADVHGWSVLPLPHGADLPHPVCCRALYKQRAVKA